MAFYYCKSGGTATGDGGRYGSEKANNSWATEFSGTTEYYDSIESAMNATTAPTDTDFIMVSSASTFSKGAAIVLTSASPPASPIQVFSVDDSAVNQYLAGASESTGGAGFDYSVSAAALGVAMHGMSIEATDDIQVTISGGAFIFNSCTLSLAESTDKFTLSSDGVGMVFNDSIITAVSGTSGLLFFITSGGTVEMNGGAIVATVGSINDIIGGGAVSGGLTAKFTGVDLSDMGSGSFLLGATGSNPSADDAINVRYIACQLNVNAGFVEEEFSSINHYFLATNCSSVSAASEYQFFQRTWAGDVEDQDDTGIHRDESIAFDGGTKISMKVTTNSACCIARPLIVDLPARFAALSSASTDTIRLYFAVSNATTLTDVNMWAELIYPDGTTKQLYNLVSNRNSDFLAAGTTHTDDSGSSTWLDGVSALTAHNEYRMDLDTSGDAGADSVPIVRIYITEPSVVIYIDPKIDAVA